MTVADEEPESFIDKMVREQTLMLRTEGARILVESANAFGTDRCKIELKCWWSTSWWAIDDTSIVIGDEKHKPFKWDEDGVQQPDEDAEDVTGWNLADCPIMLLVHRIEDGWLEDNADRKDEPLIGQFNYYAPIKTSDGVVNDKRPSVHAWIALGPNNFNLLRDRIANTDLPDFDLGLSVQFPRGTVETGWVDSKVRWDGKDALPVTSTTFVWKRGDWNSDTDRVRPVYRKPEPEEYDPPREHVELLQSNKRVESALSKLMVPVWLAAAAAVFAAFAAR